MRGVNDEGTSQTTRDDGVVVGEPASADKATDDQRAEATSERDDWMLEEEGYGYGV